MANHARISSGTDLGYPGSEETLSEFIDLVATSRRTAAQTVNAVMTMTYWQIGRRIVDHDQGGNGWVSYGEALRRLSQDLIPRFGRGFS